jgi:hypothetical protein
MRHHFPLRVRYDGDPKVGSLYLGAARNVLGLLMGDLAEANLRSGKRSKRLDNGVVVDVAFDGTQPMATIKVPPTVTGGIEQQIDLWVPQGFVLYPASNDAAAGWGAPVIPSEDPEDGPFSPANLAPGLDTSRWTAAGALGQVLVSKDKNAGYPTRPSMLTPPMYFRPDYGLHPRNTFQPSNDPTLTWAAYRVEFTDFTAQSPDAEQGEQDAIIANKRSAFDLVNAHRGTVGRDPLLLPIRGFYDSAQAIAEIMYATHTLGHYSDTYPASYATYPDRIEKDGFTSYVDPDDSDSRNKPSGGGGENSAANATAATVIGVDPNGSNIYDIVPGADITASEAYASWIGSPEHLANIESTIYDKSFTTTFLGFKKALASQTFVHKTQWVAAGNRQWISKEPEVPVLSFFGFQSLNLAWETWPATFDNSNPTTPPTDPLTILTPLRDAGDELFWLRYRFASEGGNNATFDYRNAGVPALDGRVFCRGRALAVVPDGGWVLAAAVRKYPSSLSTQPDVYRLIALAHHEDDQPPDQKTNGMTRYLRVWWCDLPKISNLPLNPEAPVRGKYGDEDEGWPWDYVNNPYSWRGGTLVDVGNDGVGTNHLKYASQWCFNNDGTKAACLRDYGEYADYVGLYRSQLEAALYVPYGLPPRLLELQLSAASAGDDIVTTVTFHAAPAGQTPQDFDVGDPSGSWKVLTTPIAVDYNADGELAFCQLTYLLNPFNANPDMASEYYSYFTFTTDYDFAPADYHDADTRFSCAIARDDIGRLPYVPMPSVMDVNDQVVVAFGMIQFSEVNLDDFTTRHNPEFACWYNNSSDVVAQVYVYRAGDLLSQRGFSNPDGTVFTLFALCYQTSPSGTYYWIGTQLPLSQNAMVLPSYAKNRDGWCVSYVVQPQASTLFRITSPSNDCDIYSDLDMSCVPTPASTLTTLLEGAAACRGGWMQASFAAEDGLVDMLAIPGENPRTLYARAV